ncbi:unnamed protein product [Ixodes hexagonus]
MAAVDGTFVGCLDADAGKYARKFYKFTAPRELGCFSVVGKHRDFLNGRAELKYLCMPRNPSALSWDLNDGFSKAVRSDFEQPEKLSKLLRWITENRQKLTLGKRTKRNGLGVDFVCKRRLLAKVARTPYSTGDEDWLFSATRFGDTLYLCKFPTESHKEQVAQDPEFWQRMDFWGHKFDQYMTSAQPGALPDLSGPLRSDDQSYVVLKGMVGRHSLLLSAEVYAIDNDVPHEPGSMEAYVEFKIAREITHKGQERSFRKKLLSAWSQSFLAGVPRVMVGFRTKDGVVQSVKEYQVKDMPLLAEGQWSDAVCFNFLDEMLSFIKECVTEDDPK